MPDPAQAPLKLTGMTLRGIGSYLHGASLEIRPLTIICGTNGSGKSTWFRALDLIRKSAALLPFGLAKESEEYERYYGCMVALLNDFVACRLLLGGNIPESQKEYGPPGTITLKLRTNENFSLPNLDHGEIFHSQGSVAKDVFYKGYCKSAVTFVLRIAFPEITTGDDDIRPDCLFELLINETTAIKFIGKGNNHVHGEPPSMDLFCTNDLLSIPIDPTTLKRIACFDEKTNRLSPDGTALSGETLERVNVLIQRVQQILALIFDGYFRLSAIRDVHLLNDTRDENSRASNNLEGAANHRAVEVVDAPDDDEVARVRLRLHEMIRDIMNEENISGKDVPSAFEFSKFYDEWLHRLLDLRWIKETGESGESMARYESPFSRGDHFAPVNLSAGFHQIAPMILQVALMKQGDTLTIENPEVHLHPGLQLKLTEFFIEMAKSGRQIVVETHSDLIIRRVLREIIQEKSSQQLFNIYFASTYKDEQGHFSSKLEKLNVNDNGQIENWPEGFLDDDVKESRSLLNAMYGKKRDADEEPNE